jgi:hypothetical protein
MTDPGLDFPSKTVSTFIDVSNSFIILILMNQLNAFR